MSDTKFSKFLAEKKLDARRILAASHKLETFTIEDRQIKLAKWQQKNREGGDAAAAKETRKPRSGRPVTDRAMQAAVSGGTLSGPTKTRILRAVNFILEQKKQEKIELKVLF